MNSGTCISCTFTIRSVSGTAAPVFVPPLRDIINAVADPEFWESAQAEAMPKPLTEEERRRVRGFGYDRFMQDRADDASAVMDFCRYMSGGTACTRQEEERALALLGRAYHVSRCRDTTLPPEMCPGWKLIRRLIDIRKKLLRVARAAECWEWLRKLNPDKDKVALIEIVTKGYMSGTFPRGQLNISWEAWDSVIDPGAMTKYPGVMPDDECILDAEDGDLALWRKGE